ncbi:MAG: YraN family protein [Deltaproteobacteria bacterium]|nr:YraN family protein [Deltaproteobacteria bacterium]
MGARQEADARAFLEARGWTVLAVNYTVRGGEADIVAMDGDTCCFVEVKARGSAVFGTAAEAVTPRKARRIVVAARRWLHEHALDGPVRFDALCRDGAGAPWVHVPDAFRPEADT